MIRLKGIALICAGLSLLFTAACSSSSSGSSSATTYTLSGTLDPGNSSSSLNASLDSSFDLEILGLRPFARTQCNDGFYYSVYCVSFSTPPVAAEGDVDCGNGGGFSVAGLPLNEPIGCFVRRYQSDSATTGSNVGAIEIPAANLNGSTDTIVAGGNVQLAVSVNSSGTISATVQSGGDNLNTTTDSTVDSAFTAANMNGVWALTCDSENGGSTFTPGLCKCFLGESSYGSDYNNQDECLADSNGPGAAISGTVSLGIGMYIYTATANTDIPLDNNQSLPSGSSIKAISIWGASGTPGSYVSLKTGGEGVTNLGGAITWGTTPLDPTQAIAWTTGSVNIQDGNNASKSVTIPSLSNPETMTHSQWLTWIDSIVASAEASGFDCNWGPGDSNANQNNTSLGKNIDCINQILEGLSKDDVGAVVPRIWIQSYCDQNGCLISTDNTNDSAKSYYSANALNYAHIEIEGWHLDYPEPWTAADLSSTGPTTGTDSGIGLDPGNRYVFEPLIVTPKGAGFRQGNEYERHFECVDSGATSEQVQDAACTSGSHYNELICYVSEELAIKFIGSASPMDVIFDQLQSVVYARLVRHSGTESPLTPSSTSGALGLCQSKISSGNGTFMAKATKQ
ncbi:MAG: hypothetical protein KDD33_12305 [Bdellovibrionales bacterium]|nr:hypothetical protein [Bdellovibrionales bacterium]